MRRGSHTPRVLPSTSRPLKTCSLFHQALEGGAERGEEKTAANGHDAAEEPEKQTPGHGQAESHSEETVPKPEEQPEQEPEPQEPEPEPEEPEPEPEPEPEEEPEVEEQFEEPLENAFAAVAIKTGWECPVCEVRNPDGKPKCGACESDNPNMPKSTSASNVTFGTGGGSAFGESCSLHIFCLSFVWCSCVQVACGVSRVALCCCAFTQEGRERAGARARRHSGAGARHSRAGARHSGAGARLAVGLGQPLFPPGPQSRRRGWNPRQRSNSLGRRSRSVIAMMERGRITKKKGTMTRGCLPTTSLRPRTLSSASTSSSHSRATCRTMFHKMQHQIPFGEPLPHRIRLAVAVR